MKQQQLNKLKLLILKFKENLEMEGFAERTVCDYPQRLKHFVEYLKSCDIEEISQIDKEVIHKYQLYLYNYKNKRGKVLSLNTQSGRLAALISFFRFLVKRNYFMYDPASCIELPKTKRDLPKGIMNRKEVNSILNRPNCDSALGLRDKAMLELLYSTGLRSAELRNLTVYDVDIQNKELRINHGKGRKDRVVPMGDIACKYVDEYMAIGRPELLKYSEEVLKYGKRKTNILFISKGAKRIQADNLIWIIKKYVKKSGLNKKVTPHSFRHTCATHMLKGKANIRHIQELLGHSSIETTQIYTRVEVSDLKKEHKRCHPRERSL